MAINSDCRSIYGEVMNQHDTQLKKNTLSTRYSVLIVHTMNLSTKCNQINLKGFLRRHTCLSHWHWNRFIRDAARFIFLLVLSRLASCGCETLDPSILMNRSRIPSRASIIARARPSLFSGGFNEKVDTTWGWGRCVCTREGVCVGLRVYVCACVCM